MSGTKHVHNLGKEGFCCTTPVPLHILKYCRRYLKVIIMDLQSFVEPRPLFQFLDPIHNW
jgi:hypothetical protein